MGMVVGMNKENRKGKDKPTGTPGLMKVGGRA